MQIFLPPSRRKYLFVPRKYRRLTIDLTIGDFNNRFDAITFNDLLVLLSPEGPNSYATRKILDNPYFIVDFENLQATNIVEKYTGKFSIAEKEITKLHDSTAPIEMKEMIVTFEVPNREVVKFLDETINTYLSGDAVVGAINFKELYENNRLKVVPNISTRRAINTKKLLHVVPTNPKIEECTIAAIYMDKEHGVGLFYPDYKIILLGITAPRGVVMHNAMFLRMCFGDIKGLPSKVNSLETATYYANTR